MRNAFFLFILTLFVAPTTQATPSKKWQTQYLEAQEKLEKNPSLGCREFTDLSKLLDFPLRKLALIRSITACNKKKEPHWKSLSRYIQEPWLQKSLRQEQFLFFSQRNFPAKAFFHYKKHRKDFDLTPREKVDLAQRALKAKISRRERRQIEKTLWQWAPRFLPKPKDNQLLSVAKDFRKAREFPQALRIYRKILKRSKMSLSQKWYAHKGIRTTYKLERWAKNKEYVEAAKNWAQFLKKDFHKSKKWTRLYHSANISYIRTLWTEKGQKVAATELDRLEKELKNRYSLQLLYWLRGKMAEENGDYQKTVHWLDLARKERNLSEDDSTRILWNLAWNQRRLKEFKASNENLERLLAAKNLTFHGKTKYLFWRAKNWQSLQDVDQSKKGFQALADLDPYGFYGSLCFRELQVSMPSIELKTIEDSHMARLFKKTEDFALFQWLIDVNEPKVSQTFLDHQLKSRKSWDADQWAHYLQLLQRSENFVAFFRKFHSLRPRSQLHINQNYPQLLFPEPYRKIVHQAAEQSKVPASLIYSIMKQESGFDPYARSFADAFGLMQLLPQVAQRMSASMNQSPYKEAADLFRPEVNIPLGAKTLNHLLAQFKQQLLLSIAGL